MLHTILPTYNQLHQTIHYRSSIKISRILELPSLHLPINPNQNFNLDPSQSKSNLYPSLSTIDQFIPDNHQPFFPNSESTNSRAQRTGGHYSPSWKGEGLERVEI